MQMDAYLKKEQIGRRELKNNRRQACPTIGLPAQNDHPPPKPPFLTPHTIKKGVNLLRIQAAICLHSSYAK